MRILIDQGTPVPLRRHLAGHTISTSFEMKWSELANGELLAEAERSGFELFITTDQNLNYQQNLQGRRIAILVLMTTSWPIIQQEVTRVISTVGEMSAGSIGNSRSVDEGYKRKWA